MTLSRGKFDLKTFYFVCAGLFCKNVSTVEAGKLLAFTRFALLP
jgi:hypothetical protein